MKYLRLIRANHWAKNLLIWVPAFFAGQFSPEHLPKLILGFIAFSLLASVIYIFNDYQDLERDKLHHLKKQRPLAKGSIALGMAFIIGLVFLLFSLTLGFFFLPPNFLLVMICYAGLNLFYSLGLKNIALLDLCLVSLGFVLRLIGGAELLEIDLSFWLLLMVFLFSMFIVIAKRRDDFRKGKKEARILRKVNRHYSKRYLNHALVVFATLMMFCYSMYTYFSPYFSGSIYYSISSIILVFIGLMRYLQLVFVENKGGSPTEFAWKDRFTQITLVLWLGLFVFLIYFR